MNRNEVKALIGITESPLTVVSPFSLQYIILPPLADDEFDLLSDEVVRVICRAIVEDMVNGEFAAMSAGVPPTTMKEYLEVGCADLASGLDTRKAVTAKFVNQAVSAVVCELTRAVRERPNGWQNYSFVLERMFPEHFSLKRVTKKDSQQSSQLEALQRQLSGAITETQAPRALVLNGRQLTECSSR